MDDFKIVRVKWIDAKSQYNMTEEELQDIIEKKAENPPFDCVGFLLRETNNNIIIAQSVLPKNFRTDETAYREVLFIPKVLVQTIIELREKKW